MSFGLEHFNAYSNGNLSKCFELLEQGAPVNQRIKNTFATPLFQTAKHANPENHVVIECVIRWRNDAMNIAVAEEDLDDEGFGRETGVFGVEVALAIKSYSKRFRIRRSIGCVVFAGVGVVGDAGIQMAYKLVMVLTVY